MSLGVVVVVTLNQIPKLQNIRIWILLNEELVCILKIQRDCIVSCRIGLVPILDGLLGLLPLRGTPYQGVGRPLLGWSTLSSENERQKSGREKARHDGDNPCLVVT